MRFKFLLVPFLVSIQQLNASADGLSHDLKAALRQFGDALTILRTENLRQKQVTPREAAFWPMDSWLWPTDITLDWRRRLFDWKGIFTPSPTTDANQVFTARGDTIGKSESSPRLRKSTPRESGAGETKEASSEAILFCPPRWVPRELLTDFEFQLRNSELCARAFPHALSFKRTREQAVEEARLYHEILDKIKMSPFPIPKKVTMAKAFNAMFEFLQWYSSRTSEGQKSSSPVEAKLPSDDRKEDPTSDCKLEHCTPRWFPGWLMSSAQRSCRMSQACARVLGNSVVNSGTVDRDSPIGQELDRLGRQYRRTYDSIVASDDEHQQKFVLIEALNQIYDVVNEADNWATGRQRKEQHLPTPKKRETVVTHPLRPAYDQIEENVMGSSIDPANKKLLMRRIDAAFHPLFLWTGPRWTRMEDWRLLTETPEPTPCWPSWWPEPIADKNEEWCVQKRKVHLGRTPWSASTSDRKHPLRETYQASRSAVERSGVADPAKQDLIHRLDAAFMPLVLTYADTGMHPPSLSQDKKEAGMYINPNCVAPFLPQVWVDYLGKPRCHTMEEAGVGWF